MAAPVRSVRFIRFVNVTYQRPRIALVFIFIIIISKEQTCSYPDRVDAMVHIKYHSLIFDSHRATYPCNDVIEANSSKLLPSYIFSIRSKNVLQQYNIII